MSDGDASASAVGSAKGDENALATAADTKSEIHDRRASSRRHMWLSSKSGTAVGGDNVDANASGSARNIGNLFESLGQFGSSSPDIGSMFHSLVGETFSF